MSMFLPDALTDGQRAFGLTISAVLIVWGLGAASWHLWGGGRLTWRSSLFGPTKLVPFADLQRLAPEHGVPLPRYGAGQNNAYHLEGALQQAAVRGRLAVEGRQYRGPVRFNDPLVPIPADHFRDFGFAHGVLGYGASNNQSRTGDVDMMVKRLDGRENVTFYDLHINEREAIRVIKEFSNDPQIERPQ